jgi:hypothetical protein
LKSFLYQAASWKKVRRVVAKVEFHFGIVPPRGLYRHQLSMIIASQLWGCPYRSRANLSAHSVARNCHAFLYALICCSISALR